MSEASYTYTFQQDLKTITAAMRSRPPGGLPAVRGQGWASVIKLVQCVMLGLGAVGVSVGVEYLVSGQLGLNIWGLAVGVVLLYVAVFGTLLVILPVMARRAMATRVNQGPVTLTVSQEGLHTKMNTFESRVDWAGIEAVSRNKQAIVFWLGGNRPSLPLHAIGDAAEADALFADATRWVEASR